MSENKNKTGFGDKAQEMLMLDMLDGMHEFFTQSAYHSSQANSFKILPSEKSTTGENHTDVDQYQGNSADVISFSEARARRVMRQNTKGKGIVAHRSLNKLR